MCPDTYNSLCDSLPSTRFLLEHMLNTLPWKLQLVTFVSDSPSDLESGVDLWDTTYMCTLFFTEIVAATFKACTHDLWQFIGEKPKNYRMLWHQFLKYKTFNLILNFFVFCLGVLSFPQSICVQRKRPVSVTWQVEVALQDPMGQTQATRSASSNLCF